MQTIKAQVVGFKRVVGDGRGGDTVTRRYGDAETRRGAVLEVDFGAVKGQ